MKSFINKIYKWHPDTPFFYGWLILIIIGCGQFIATSLAQSTFGGVQDLIVNNMSWDRKTIALTATFGTWTAGAISPFIGKSVDKFGPRWIMFIAAILVGGGLIVLSNVQTLWEFFFIYIIIRAIAGPNLQNVVPRTVAVNFFESKKNMALGITALSRIFGESANLQIITILSTLFSWRIAYRVLGLIALPLSIPIFLIIRHKPEEIDLLVDGNKINLIKEKIVPKKEKKWATQEILKLPAFWIVILGDAAAVICTSMIIFQLVPFSVDSGTSQITASLALTLGNLLGGFFIPVWGLIIDKTNIKAVAISVILACMLITSLFLMSSPGIISFSISLIWTSVTTITFVLGTMLLASIFNRESFGTVQGIAGLARTISLGLGPSIGAFSISWAGSYTPIFLIGVSGYAITIFLYMNLSRTSNH